jgi:SAM-dependent methyltransferase
MIVNSHGTGAVSDWIQRWSHLVSPQGQILDVACGRGRHLRWFCSRGHPVTGVDRAPEAIESVADLVSSGQAQAMVADIENGPWPLMQSGKTRQFDAVVVTNYLWRPLFITLLDSLAPGGVLLYETFATGNETVGKPSRTDFLLQPGELLQVCKDLRVVAYEDGFLGTPDRFVQRIAAIRPIIGANGLPQRYALA